MKKKLLWLLAVLFLLVGSTGTLAYYFTEWQWFRSLDYQQVFTTILFSKISIGVAAAVLTFLFVFLNLKWLQKWLARAVPEDNNEPEVIQVDFSGQRQRVQNNFSEWGRVIARSPLLSWIIFLFSAVVGISNGLAFAAHWLAIQSYFKQTAYGVTDPIFNKDISFYLFSLPIYELVLQVLFGLVLFLFAICAFFYFSNGGFRRAPLDRRPYTHLGILGAIAFLLQGGNFLMSMYNLVYSPKGVAFGASYTDVHVTLPALYVCMGLSVFSALLMLSQIVKPRLKTAWVPLAMVALVAVLGESIVPALIQNLQVNPNEFTMEEEYLNYNIAYTRMAYDLDNTNEINFPIANNSTANWTELEEYSTSLDTAPLLNYQQTHEAFSQLQGMRLYYRFNDVDVDRYQIGGKLVPVMISARELPVDALQTEADTWVNRHLKYTHGYGAVVAPSNEITSDGQPKLIVKDIPPRTEVAELAVSRPEIYFGELTQDYVIVGTKSQEFDYPQGDANAETSYQGKDGLPINSFFARILFSIRLNTVNPLLTNEITPDSKILLHREITERVQTLAPFLSYDKDPYLVINEGRLLWIIDAYTVSSQFPYAQSWQLDGQSKGANYLRNSVKVTVDAYDGTTIFYLYNETDPIIQTYAKIFPNLFIPYAAMPQGLKDHIRYPEDFFTVQTSMFLNYHMTDAKVFYNREDAWAVATTNDVTVQPYYDILEFPGSDTAEFMNLYPLTPAQKDNMVAFLAGAVGEDGTGKLSVYIFPKDKLVYGPAQIEARINQQAEISKDLSLWDQGGSTVTKGHTITVPLKDSLIYIIPLYITSDSSSLPELKKVIVTYGSNVVMKDNLEQALAAIFGSRDGEGGAEVPSGTSGDDRSLTTLIQDILAQYAIVTEQRKAGNWTEYGAALDALEAMLAELGNEDLAAQIISLPTVTP
ncbi:MAG: UPF0182 family protein [Negativicutes bacterium]|nr:UPF0182 family protein [Negativicutes bacterium]